MARRIPLLAARFATGLATGLAACAHADVVVNEVLGSTSGADAEYIELYGRGPGATAIGGWTVELWESDGGDGFGSPDADSPYTVPAGTTLPEGGYFLFANALAQSAFSLTADAPLPNDAIENSAYTLILRDADGNLVDSFFLTDGGTEDVANVAGMLITPTATIGPDGSFVPPGFTRTPDGGDTIAALGFDVGDPSQTPTASGGAPPPPPTGERTTIMAIQGAAHTSPLLGQAVVTGGVVTAVDSNGFYLQDPEGDGDIATSDAVFVFTGGAPAGEDGDALAAGDVVRVSGTVAEFFPGGEGSGNLSTTQLGDATIAATGTAALPAPVVTGMAGRPAPDRNIDDDAFASFDPDSDGIDYFESLEAMRVTVPEPLAIAPTNRFGELFTVADGGAGASGVSERLTLNIAPDDFNPEKIQIDEDSGILPGFELPFVDAGARLADVTGVVGYGFGNFEVYPTAAFEVAPSGLVPETTTLAGDEDRLSIATYNVLNLDPNEDDGDTDIADGRFAAIAGHIVDNLGAPDIVGLQEVQDGSGSADDGTTSAAATLETLVEAILDAGGPRYAFADTEGLVDKSVGGQPGGNIRVAFLYDTERVALNGTPTPLTDPADQATNVMNPFFGSRIPLAATFSFDGQDVTVLSNHFSSKGGSAPILGVEQPFDERQEDIDVNGSLDERRLQAEAVDAFVAARLDESSDAAVVVLGDFNEFEFVSPLAEILSRNLENTTFAIPEEERYSFVFQGNSQQLDHVLVSANLAEDVEVDIVHVNAEFAETSTRASDHDPVLVTVSLEPAKAPGGADLNGDGQIDRADYLAFVRAFRTRVGERRYDPAADFDKDGRVRRGDLHRFLALYRVSLEGRAHGDVNGDGAVDFRDLRRLERVRNSRAGQRAYRPEADLNADGRVNRRDVRLLESILIH